jgi:hypothetical protein
MPCPHAVAVEITDAEGYRPAVLHLELDRGQRAKGLVLATGSDREFIAGPMSEQVNVSFS